MCMWFWYIPCINFCHFSTLWTYHFLTSDSMKVYRQWVSCERNSPYNFIPIFLKLTHVFSMVWRCTCVLDIIFELIFVAFSALLTLSFFTSDSTKVYSRYLVSTTAYTISYLSLCNFAHPFSKVWRCACDLDFIMRLFFVTFPLC